jgi:hypothetical protein
MIPGNGTRYPDSALPFLNVDGKDRNIHLKEIHVD